MAQPLVVEGRVIKGNWKEADLGLPILQGLPQDKAEKKLETIQSGGRLAEEYPPFPETRSCQDCFWILFFFVTGLAVLCAGWAVSGKLWEHLQEKSSDIQAHEENAVELSGVSIGAMVLAAFATAVLSSIGYVMLARRQPACVVWTSLIFGPVFTIVLGVAGIVAGAASGQMGVVVIGFILCLLGVCSLTCVLCCWKDLIPFMIKLTEVVADVIEEHPCCIGVGLIGGLMAFLWTTLMAVALASVAYAYPQLTQKGNNAAYGFTFVTALVFTWGAGVASNICHVTYCGVFGRWYYGGQDASDSDGSHVSANLPALGKGTPNTLAPSFKVAITTSLGSICCGSFLVAFVRAAEAVARRAEREAQQDGNILGCIVACIIRVFIECIGDFLEYFNDWAYVQCAIRGVSFIQAANITYSMITATNVHYILSDLLLGSLVSAGCMMAGAICAIVTAAVGFATGGLPAAGIGAGLGLLIGVVAGSAALGVINSGVKTILACWAEDDRPLRDTHPEVHQALFERIRHHMSAF